MKRSPIPLVALALLSLAVITGCATTAAMHPSPVPQARSAEVTAPSGERTSTPPQVSVGVDVPTDLPADSGLVSLATAHLKRASELAANGGDPVGKACHDSSLNLVLLLSIGIGHEEGFAPKLEKARLLAKTLKGPAVEQWEVSCAPVAFEAKMDLLALAKAIFGDVIAAKVGLPIVGAVKGMLP